MAAAKSSSRILEGPLLVLVTACVASFVVAYNNTALMTALPALKSELDMDAVSLQWVMNSYLLAAASLVVVMGRFSDIFGKMRLFLFGVIVFAVSSAALTFAQDTLMMLAFRFIQGIGASSVFSNSAALINVTTPEKERPVAIGIWAGVITFGLGVGPLMGGFLTEVISWRFIFATDVVLLLISLFLAWRLLKLGIVTPQEEKREPVDYFGAAVLTITLATLVYAISHGKTSGWTSPTILAAFAVGIACAVVFYVTEHRTKSPLVHFGLFEIRAYVGATIAMFVVGYILFGCFFFFNLFLQSPNSLHLSAVSAGLAVLPISVPMLLISVFLPKRLERQHFRWAIATGMLLLAIGIGLMSLSTNQTTYAEIWWKFAIIGCGLGLTFPLVPTVGLRDLADNHAGQGAGVINTCLFIGAILGVVVGGLITANVAHEFVANAIQALPDKPTVSVELIHQLAHGSASDIKGALANFSSSDAAQLKTTLADLEDDTFDAVMISMAMMAAIGALASITLMRDQPMGPIA
ncbi:MAG: MFS transporter [Pseudomonadota bacterium]